MCEFLSFLTNREGRVWVGDLHSHSGVAAGYGLKPGTYREAEWTGEEEKHLTVRTEDGENENEYRAAILALYPTRAALLKSITEGRVEGLEYQFKDGKIQQVTRKDGRKTWLETASKEQIQQVVAEIRQILPHRVAEEEILKRLTLDGDATKEDTQKRWTLLQDFGRVSETMRRNPAIFEILSGMTIQTS